MSFESRLPFIRQLGFREEALPKLRNYLDLLWSSNEELNLISRKMTFDELMDNHVIDCLLPLAKFPADKVKSVADFGSGGGLPGVLYAIQFPDLQFHLFEKSKLKQDFLNKCRAISPNIQVRGEIPVKLDGVDVVISRAFKPVDVILDMSRSYYEKGGSYFLLKGRLEKIEEEIADAKKKFKNLEVRVEPLKSPVLEVERHLVLIQ